MKRLLMIPAAGSLVLLAGCETARQVNASPPTVTYAYQAEGEYAEVEDRADKYCADRYGSVGVLIERRLTDSGYEATFACD